MSPALADAHDTNYADFSTSYARRVGSDLDRDASFDRAIIDLPALPYNGVFRSNLARVDIARVAAETITLAKRRRVPVAWRVTPTTPPHTAAALEAVGWHVEQHVPVMAKELSAGTPLTRRGATVEEVTTAGLPEWSRVVALSFGCPEEYVEGPASYDRDAGVPGETDLRRFLLRIDGEPLASSALLPGSTRSGLAGIFCVGTLERVRGQGLGTIITQAAMDAARDAGTRVAVLQASELGRPVYERLGFDTVASIGVHIPEEAAWAISDEPR
ncbi:MAG TPA: GNAT family N-acetyltransferase [Acidimicrobiia bacterium]|nr:GNAT family N-acetyltransferase [Acidimicrobiia bacterium]